MSFLNSSPQSVTLYNHLHALINSLSPDTTLQETTVIDAVDSLRTCHNPKNRFRHPFADNMESASSQASSSTTSQLFSIPGINCRGSWLQEDHPCCCEHGRCSESSSDATRRQYFKFQHYSPAGSLRSAMLSVRSDRRIPSITQNNKNNNNNKNNKKEKGSMVRPLHENELDALQDARSIPSLPADMSSTTRRQTTKTKDKKKTSNKKDRKDSKRAITAAKHKKESKEPFSISSSGTVEEPCKPDKESETFSEFASVTASKLQNATRSLLQANSTYDRLLYKHAVIRSSYRLPFKLNTGQSDSKQGVHAAT